MAFYLRLFYALLFFCLYFILFSCSKSSTAPPPKPPEGPAPVTVSLSVVDMGLTDAWLRLAMDSDSLPLAFSLMRDGMQIAGGLLHSADTVLADSGLAFGRSYTYQAFHLAGNTAAADSSLPLPAATLDTTGQGFSWAFHTFGDLGSSVFNDVAIIDENNIWAVGLVSIDSAGEEVKYNAAHWDGNNWELCKISVELFGGFSGIAMLKSVYVIDPLDIWFASSGGLIQWDGQAFEQKALFLDSLNDPHFGQINQIWGTDESNIYSVGNNGFITHYNGSSWQRIESGTDLDFEDIWGAWDWCSRQYEVLAVASKSTNRFIARLDGLSLIPLSNTPINWSLASIWFSPGRHYYVAGSGIYEKNCLSQANWENEPLDITTYYTHRIRGEHVNNVAAAGGFGEVLHFNGASWKSYFPTTMLTNGNYKGVAIQGDIIVAVGLDNPKAVIAIGKRNP